MKRGRKRVGPNEVCRQWDRGDRHGALRNSGRSLRAFNQHLLELRPDSLATYAGAYYLAGLVRDEVPCLVRCPFGGPTEDPVPALNPAPEADNREPFIHGVSPSPTAPSRSAGTRARRGARRT